MPLRAMSDVYPANKLAPSAGEFRPITFGALVWEWPAWNLSAPWLIWLIGYLPFFVVAYWVHDMASLKRQIAVVATLAAGVAVALVVFGGLLEWI